MSALPVDRVYELQQTFTTSHLQQHTIHVQVHVHQTESLGRVNAPVTKLPPSRDQIHTTGGTSQVTGQHTRPEFQPLPLINHYQTDMYICIENCQVKPTLLYSIPP